MNEERSLKRKLYVLTIVPLVLTLALLAFCTFFYGLENATGLASGILFVIVLVAFIVAFIRLRPLVNSTLVSYALEQGKIQKELLEDLEVPYVLLDENGDILWANRLFHNIVGINESKRIRKNIDNYFPILTPELFKSKEPVNMDIEYGDKFYNATIKREDLTKVFESEDSEEKRSDNVVVVLYLFDVTELKKYMKENEEQKLIAGLLYVDNYDEVMGSLPEVKHTVISAFLDRKINQYFMNIDAISKKLEKDKYFFVFRQKYMPVLKDNKFSIIEEVKGISAGNEIRATVSMGVGCGSDSFITNYEYAKAAIGLALARGGDQAAVKTNEQVTYYGGKSAGSEKATRVKARVKAQAFEELLATKEKVIIMGHKRPDADSFGSAVGVYRLATTLNKKAYIVVNEVTSAIRPLINNFKGSNIYGDMIVTSEQALALVDPYTLLVVVDVNRPSLTECEELLSVVHQVVVVDHHRQSNEIIENATLSYIEPFASSACEMVAEILQYINEKPTIRPVEADAMYAGMLIDTDNFLNKTGVRTFEAAAYLRQVGADVTRVRKMFRSDFSEMKERAKGISNSENYMNMFALSHVEPDENSDAPTVIAAKVANELLNVDGIKASFVVTKKDDTLFVSARSVDDVNVQLVMEKFGGGGHANIAGVQLKNKDKDEFFTELKDVLKKMYEEGDL